MLLANAKRVAEHSYNFFCEDEIILWNLVRALVSDTYTVSLRTQLYLRRLLGDTYGDSLAFKNFEKKIEFLSDTSEALRDLLGRVEQLADTTQNYSLEIGQQLGIRVPCTLTSPRTKAS